MADSTVGTLRVTANSATVPAVRTDQSGAGPTALFMGGNVGIGTTSPTSSLEVSGDVTISGGSIKQEAWITPTFQNSWLDYGSTGDTAYGPTGYYRDKQGTVWLRGIVRAGVTDNCAFTLPVGYRPIKVRMFATYSGNGVCRIDVMPSGCVSVRSFCGNSYAGLDGVAFRSIDD
ncbi:MAG: hypothetical protein FJ146_18455 [Deltaproteobacteria bacterium]|nr:hypothetical protein [Deltaproteobacteria bacterium]